MFGWPTAVSRQPYNFVCLHVWCVYLCAGKDGQGNAVQLQIHKQIHIVVSVCWGIDPAPSVRAAFPDCLLTFFHFIATATLTACPTNRIQILTLKTWIILPVNRPKETLLIVLPATTPTALMLTRGKQPCPLRARKTSPMEIAMTQPWNLPLSLLLTLGLKHPPTLPQNQHSRELAEGMGTGFRSYCKQRQKGWKGGVDRWTKRLKRIISLKKVSKDDNLALVRFEA